MFPVNRAWTESGATWNQAQSGANWATLGCNGVGTDRAGTPVGSVRLNQASGAITVNLPVSLLSGWLSDPAGNQGLLLRPKSNSAGATMTYSLASSEHGTASYRPKLTVSYTLPSGRLSPDSAALLAALPVGLAQPAGWSGVAPEAVATPPAGHTWRSYYFLGGQRVAQRERSAGNPDQVYYLLGDHLGSTSAVADETGGLAARQWYYPYGSPRPPGSSALPTDRRFTGQRSEEDTLGSLYDFVARPYSPALGRFLAPDSIIPEPGNPQALNRYAYSNNNPLRYVDPSGHAPAPPGCVGMGSTIGDCGIDGWFGYEDWWVKTALRVELDQAAVAPVKAVVEVASFVFEPVDYIATGLTCLSGDCSLPMVVAAALPGISGSVGRHEDEIGAVINHFAKQVAQHADKPAIKLVDGMRLTTDDALQAATDFLGEGYKDLGNGRFVSKDGLRQVRMGDSDILGKHGNGPHINFESLRPRPGKPGKFDIVDPKHIYLTD